MNTQDAIDPADMTVDQLRAEVWFWRDSAARQLAAALNDLAAESQPRSRAEIAAKARDWAGILEAALTHEDLEKCALCGDLLIPGQAALRCVDEGDVHAHCLGTRLDGDGPGKPGDRFQLDPEGVVDSDDEPIPDSDGVLVAYAFRPLRPTADMVALITESNAATGRA